MSGINFDGEVHSVKDLVGKLSDSGIEQKGYLHVRWWFRGQPTAGHDLQPKVYRPEFKASSKEELLSKERLMAQDFRIMSAGLRTGMETDVELHFLQQHYGMPTRLLDWTNNPLAALYFATNNDSKADGELFLVDPSRLACEQKIDDDTWPGIGTSRREVFQKAVKIITDWKGTPIDFPCFIMPVRPDYFDRRVSLQRSCFTFTCPKVGN